MTSRTPPGTFVEEADQVPRHVRSTGRPRDALIKAVINSGSVASEAALSYSATAKYRLQGLSNKSPSRQPFFRSWKEIEGLIVTGATTAKVEA